jgi:bla regulator protein BlaR1
LENENMHTFKRMYLLASLAAALIIPALVFTEYVEAPPIAYEPNQENIIPQGTTGPIGIPMALEKDILDIEPILWAIYCIGVLFFGLKFLKNLYQILKRINKNPKQKWEQFIHVLLKDPLPPHTFLSYIFLNKQKFESKGIPKEVLLHEQTHARQKHSYDILFVEFLQVVFWINPFIYFIKKSIKLNHEFLADQAVIKKGISQTKYQNTLLSYLSHDSFEKQESTSIANAINYSSIKKRFNIMKTKTSKKAILLRSLLLLPLFTLLLVGFSTTNTIEVQKEIEATSSGNGTSFQKPLTNIENLTRATGTEFITVQNQQETIDEIILKINKNGQLLFKDDIVSLSDLKDSLLKINNDLSKEQRQNMVAAVIYVDEETSKLIIDKVETILNDYGTATIDVKKALPPNYTKSQNGITSKQLAKYNKLAKHYNSQSRNKMKIYKKDVERLEYLFSTMSDKQKADNEPFPDFPEPPPAPKAPKASNEREEATNTIQKIIDEQDPYDVVNSGIRINSKGKKVVFPQSAPLSKEMEKNMESQTEKMKEQEILMKKEEAQLEKQEIAITRQEEKMEEQEVMMEKMEVEMEKKQDTYAVQQSGEQFYIPKPPMPPKPVTPLDHVVAMAKIDAQFFYEGQEISSDKAIELMKINKDLNIDSRAGKGEQPVVKISASPIRN